MPWVNYHSHSDYCDGRSSPEAFIVEAISKGFKAYGCSSHAPVSFASPWNMPLERLQEYLDDIATLKSKYAGQIQVYTGIEADYLDGNPMSGMLKSLSFDYRIGSVHFLDPLPDGTWFCFDGKPDGFFHQISLLYQNDFTKAIRRYYHHVREMVMQDVPDIIGHMDKIKMHNSVKWYVDEEDQWYIKEVEDTLDVIALKGCIVEVNTRGLYKHDPPLLYPSPWILKRIGEKKIPVVINSDAHHPSEIDSGYPEAAEALLHAGINTVRVLIDGIWCDAPLAKDGLNI